MRIGTRACCGSSVPSPRLAPQRDHRGGDVLANLVGRIALALPVVELRVQVDGRRSPPARDAQRDLGRAALLDRDGLAAHQLHRAGPDPRARGLAHPVEE